MSKVKIEGNASGTGTLTISAPNTNTDRSLTLPDSAGEFVTADTSGDVTINGNIQFGTNSTAGELNCLGDVFTLNVDSDTNTGGTPNIQFKTSGTERMRIDSSGRVTMPYQPMFHVYGSGANSIYGTSSPVVTFNSVIENTGSHYNDTTYRFTAPVDGNYYFSSMVRLDGANTGYFRSQIRKNGSNNYVWGHQINDYGSWSPSYATFSGSVVYKLSANDYVEVVIESNTDTSWTLYRTESSFYGILLS